MRAAAIQPGNSSRNRTTKPQRHEGNGVGEERDLGACSPFGQGSAVPPRPGFLQGFLFVSSRLGCSTTLSDSKDAGGVKITPLGYDPPHLGKPPLCPGPASGRRPGRRPAGGLGQGERKVQLRGPPTGAAQAPRLDPDGFGRRQFAFHNTILPTRVGHRWSNSREKQGEHRSCGSTPATGMMRFHDRRTVLASRGFVNGRVANPLPGGNLPSHGKGT